MRLTGYIGRCDCCGKNSYESRAVARRAMRSAPFNTKGMREYRCRLGIGWHFGHLPQAAMHGLRSAAEVYKRKRGAA